MSQAAMTWDFGQVKELQRLLNKAGSRDFTPLLKSLGKEVQEQTRKRFEEKEGPEGPWDDWSEAYALKQAGTGHSILEKEGDLVNSIDYELEGSDGILVGSVERYAATHQYGDNSRGIPDRPYLGITTENERALLNIVNGFLRGDLF